MLATRLMWLNVAWACVYATSILLSSLVCWVSAFRSKPICSTIDYGHEKRTRGVWWFPASLPPVGTSARCDNNRLWRGVPQRRYAGLSCEVERLASSASSFTFYDRTSFAEESQHQQFVPGAITTRRPKSAVIVVVAGTKNVVKFDSLSADTRSL